MKRIKTKTNNKNSGKKQEVESHFCENYMSGCFNVVDIQYNSEKQGEGTYEREHGKAFADAREQKPLYRKENKVKQMGVVKGGGLHERSGPFRSGLTKNASTGMEKKETEQCK